MAPTKLGVVPGLVLPARALQRPQYTTMHLGFLGKTSPPVGMDGLKTTCKGIRRLLVVVVTLRTNPIQWKVMRGPP